MIKVVAPTIIKENHLPDALPLYQRLVNETVKEQGCVSFELFQELENPNRLTLIEEWDSEEALNLHMKTPHFTSFIKQLAPFKEELPAYLYKKLF